MNKVLNLLELERLGTLTNSITICLFCSQSHTSKMRLLKLQVLIYINENNELSNYSLIDINLVKEFTS